MDPKFLVTALVAAFLLWIFGSKPQKIQYLASWIGWKRQSLALSLGAAASLATGLAGAVFVEIFNNSVDTTHWFLRGLAAGGIGQAAARVQFNKLPTAGSSLSLLGKAMEWITDLQTTSLEPRQFSCIKKLEGDQLTTAASTIQQTVFAADEGIPEEVRDAVTKNLETRIQESLNATTSSDKKAAENALQNYLIVIVPKYKIPFRYLK